MGRVADIPINILLGIVYDKETSTVRLGDSAAVQNHFGQTSFCAQFALAEAASGQFLFDELDMQLETDMPTLRNATTRFFKPTLDECVCNLVSLAHSREQFQSLLNTKGKLSTSLKVEVVTAEGVKSLVAEFQWLVLRNVSLA